MEQNRVLHVIGTINEENTKEIIESIIAINVYDDKQQSYFGRYKREPIKLLVNSFGGSVYSGFAVVDIIKNSRTPVHTICVGKAMSAGFLILIAGHERYSYPNSKLLYHQPSWGAKGTLQDMRETIQEVDIMEKHFEEFTLECTKIPKARIDEVRVRKIDWYMTPKEALKLGVIDKIISKNIF